MLICRVGFSVTETLCIHETFLNMENEAIHKHTFFVTSFYKKNELITPQPLFLSFLQRLKQAGTIGVVGEGRGGGTHLTFSRRKYFFFHLHIENCEIMQLLIPFWNK